MATIRYATDGVETRWAEYAEKPAAMLQAAAAA